MVTWSYLTLLHSEKPKLFTILAFLSAIGLNKGHQICRYMLKLNTILAFLSAIGLMLKFLIKTFI